jgi:hypothetical protein
MTPELVLLLLRIGIAVALYAVLLTVVSYLRKDIKAAQTLPKSIPEVHLRAADNQLNFLLSASNIVGRSWESTVRVDDETVSSSHARISFQEGQWWVEDLDSRNGTYLNDITVEAPIVLTDGDVLKFGRVPVRFERGRVSEDQEG